MFCNKCGAQLDDTAVFCGQCGNPISGGKQTGQKAMQPGARAVQRKTIYAIGALLAAVVVTGIIVVFGIRSAGKSEELDLYSTSWTVENGSERGVFHFEDDGYLHALEQDGDYISKMSFRVNSADNTIIFGDDPITFVYKYELSEDTLELVSVGHEKSYIFMDELFRNKIFLRETEARIILHRSASLYGSWRDSSGTVGIDIYEDGNIRIAGIEETQGVDAFTYTEKVVNTLELTADLDRKVFRLKLRYVIDGNVMTVEIADHTFELEKVE